MPSRLHVALADITTLAVDALVNAANTSLLGGAGVDGAIHLAAGPDLYEVCSGLGGCQVGDAKITRGYKLRALNVIHAVGPKWKGGTRGEQALLESCYRRSIALAEEHQLTSLAFPCISTGVRGFPKTIAARVAIGAVQDMVPSTQHVKDIWFCCYDSESEDIYRRLLQSAA